METLTINTEILKDTIKVITQSGKGILAADESNGTAGKRLATINVENSEENRRRYRTALLTAPNMEEYISGVILFEETLYQKNDDGIPLPKVLSEKGIVPGIKVDQGLVDLNDKEKFTQGLDGLGERLEKYKKTGVGFAKWRAVFSIGVNLPSDEAVRRNAEDLSKYAKVCQEHGIVPIVEPEVLIDGNHSIETCKEVTGKVLEQVFDSLKQHEVVLECIILKPSMVISGKDGKDRAGIQEVAEATVSLFKKVVPEEVPTINFLSGGQGPEESTQHLQAINKINGTPWKLSFSYGRALQQYCLTAWDGKDENVEEAQNAFLKRAKLNSLAVKGEYSEDLE